MKKKKEKIHKDKNIIIMIIETLLVMQFDIASILYHISLIIHFILDSG